jgi:predicted RecB family nuclease
VTLSVQLRIGKHQLKASLTECRTKAWIDARTVTNPSLALRNIFLQGNDFERRVIEQTADVIYMPVNSTLAIHGTQTCNVEGFTIAQPAFDLYGITIRPDLLNKGDARLSEIKSGTSVKNDYVLDLAIGAEAARLSGLTIETMELIHVNRDHRHGGTEPLFQVIDVTGEVATILQNIDLEAEISILQSETMPPIEQKNACRTCDLKTFCYDDPASLVVNIPRICQNKLDDMLGNGIETIDRLLTEEEHLENLTPKQRTYVASFANAVNHTTVAIDVGAIYVYGPWALEDEHLHLDFETSSTAVPMLPGQKPWQQTLTQFSMTHDDGETITESHYLVNSDCSDMEDLAMALIAAANIAPNASIVVYNASFERGRLMELADAYPNLRDELLSIVDRLVDLFPLVKRAVRGLQSYSLKAVAPLLEPSFSYDGLTIDNGEMANAVMTLLRLEGGAEIIEQHTGLGIQEARKALLAYCANDTLGTAVILRALKASLESE